MGILELIHRSSCFLLEFFLSFSAFSVLVCLPMRLYSCAISISIMMCCVPVSCCCTGLESNILLSELTFFKMLKRIESTFFDRKLRLWKKSFTTKDVIHIMIERLNNLICSSIIPNHLHLFSGFDVKVVHATQENNRTWQYYCDSKRDYLLGNVLKWNLPIKAKHLLKKTT